MKVELVSKCNEAIFEDCVNNCISDKKVKDIKFTHLIGKDNVMIYSALIMYEE
ncbi:MAG: hypothetical protein KGI27_00825 [Thaumarchaeota archaeon]|nr:hypothetical protein [Nitrososphaerota archaeon]